MTKPVKITIGILASIIILVAVTLISLTYFISPHYLKQTATNWFADNTDRTLEINGNVSWHFLPTLGLTAKNIVISNPKQFGDSAFIQAKTVSASLSLSALLQKQIKINRLGLNQVELDLITNTDGIENWHLNLNKTKKNTSSNTAHSPEHSSMSLMVGRIALKNSRIVWHNKKTGQKILLTKTNLKSSSIAFNKPFTISGRAHVASADPQINSDIDINGKAQFDNQQQILNVKDFEFASSHKNDPMRTFSVHTTGLFDFKQATFKLDAIEFEYAKAVAGRGKLVGKNIYTHPTLNGHLSTNTFDLKQMLNNIGYPVKTTHRNALSSVMLDGSFIADPKQITLKNFKLRVDNTSIKTNVSYNLIKHDAKIKIEGGHLNTNDFRGISLAKKSSKSKAIQKKKDVTQRNNKFTVQGDVSFISIKTANAQLTDVKTGLSYRNNVLTLAPFSAKIFGGNTAGKIVLNTHGNSPSFNVAQQMNNINLGVMLGTLFQQRPLTGTAKMVFDIAASGTSEKSILKSLTGKADIQTVNGIAHGVDIDYQFAQVFAYLNKSKVKQGDTRQTEYQKAHAKLTINKGVVHNSLFDMSLAKFHLQGNGMVNLLNQQLDYQIGIKSLESVRIKTPVSSTNLADFHIPLQIKGTIGNPKPTLDLPKIAVITLQETAKNLLTDQVKGGPVLKQVIDSPIGDVVKKPLGEALKKVLPF